MGPGYLRVCPVRVEAVKMFQDLAIKQYLILIHRKRIFAMVLSNL